MGEVVLGNANSVEAELIGSDQVLKMILVLPNADAGVPAVSRKRK